MLNIEEQLQTKTQKYEAGTPNCILFSLGTFQLQSGEKTR